MSTRGPRLVLLGKQGAGKGTQASRIAEHYDVAHLSTGDLFREAAAAHSELGLAAKDYMDRGDLVPDETVVGVVEEQLNHDYRIRRGFVLDGFPRTRRQAEELHRILEGHPLDLAIDLDVPTEIVLKRIAGRRVCSECGTVYHVDQPPTSSVGTASGASTGSGRRSHSSPAGDWKCDVCGGQVVQRDDDTEEAVMRRLELYEIETLPVIQFYRRTGALAHVDGSAESDEVFKKLVETVESRLDREKP
jgi:adenylate kinase